MTSAQKLKAMVAEALPGMAHDRGCSAHPASLVIRLSQSREPTIKDCECGLRRNLSVVLVNCAPQVSDWFESEDEMRNAPPYFRHDGWTMDKYVAIGKRAGVARDALYAALREQLEKP